LCAQLPRYSFQQLGYFCGVGSWYMNQCGALLLVYTYTTQCHTIYAHKLLEKLLQCMLIVPLHAGQYYAVL